MSISLFLYLSSFSHWSSIATGKEGKVHCVRPGKKKRELEEGELDHREAKEIRRRERDMV